MLRKENPSNIQLVMGPLEWGMLVVLSILWGGSFFFVEVAVRTLPTLTIVTLRVGLAALALWGYILVSRRSIPAHWEVWSAFLIMGCLNNIIPFSLIVWGQQSIASGLASILNAATPLFTVIVAGLLLSDEALSLRKVVGVLLGLAGVIVMIGFEVVAGPDGDFLGQLAILGAALSYAFAGVFGRRFKTLGVDPIVVAAGQVTASSLLLFPVTLWVENPLSAGVLSWDVIAAIVGLALISTAIAYVLYFELLARAGATNLLLVTLLIPVSAILLGWLFLEERLTIVQVVGMACIAVGLLVMDGRLVRRPSTKACRG